MWNTFDIAPLLFGASDTLGWSAIYVALVTDVPDVPEPPTLMSLANCPMVPPMPNALAIDPRFTDAPLVVEDISVVDVV